MKRWLAVYLFIVMSWVAIAQTYTVETVPNEKLRTNSYVSNPDHILTDETVKQIDGLLGALEQSNTAQVAVVVLNSIGEEDHIDFAQRLFDSWGIGQASVDNGLLILFILDQREIRLHTGYGLEGVLTDAVCKRIEMNEMVPFFKAGNYDQGMLAGVKKVTEYLSDPELAKANDAKSRELKPETPLYIFISIFWSGLMLAPFLFHQISGHFRGQGRTRKADMRISRKQWALLYMAVPAFLICGTIFLFEFESFYPYLAVFIIYNFAVSLYRFIRIDKAAEIYFKDKEYGHAFELYRSFRIRYLVLAILLPVPMAIFYYYYIRKQKFYRNFPRICKQCGQACVKLDELSDNLFLLEGQVFEEELGTIDYDVWQCQSCRSVQTEKYVSRMTKYQDCPACHTRAFYSVSRETITSPTTSHSGQGLETKECKFCSHSEQSTYTIPKVTRSSSSSRSSSGGGSWGGGRSGGGGSSSSW